MLGAAGIRKRDNSKTGQGKLVWSPKAIEDGRVQVQHVYEMHDKRVVRVQLVFR